MKTNRHTPFWLGLLMLAAACQPDTTSEPAPTDAPRGPLIASSLAGPSGSGLISQADLDSAIRVVQPADRLILGNPFGVRTDPAEINSIREILTNKRLNEPFRPGHIIVIRSFENRNGERGNLRNNHIMVKRAAGYNPAGGDFEYINIDFDPQHDYARHPNGALPALTDTQNRGIDIARFRCVQCHQHTSAGGDFLFTSR
jgi:hypothetical protein